MCFFSNIVFALAPGRYTPLLLAATPGGGVFWRTERSRGGGDRRLPRDLSDVRKRSTTNLEGLGERRHQTVIRTSPRGWLLFGKGTAVCARA